MSEKWQVFSNSVKLCRNVQKPGCFFVDDEQLDEVKLLTINAYGDIIIAIDFYKGVKLFEEG